MRVLMLGWEFPPFFAGGAGMVCYELTRELVKFDDVDLTYVMPFGPDEVEDAHLRLLVADKFKAEKVRFRRVPSLIGAYMSQEDYDEKRKSLLGKCGGSSSLRHDNTLSLYGENLLEEVYNFAERVGVIVGNEDFDVIHAHDWTTFPAAIRASEILGKPFIVHVHVTEFDKSGGAGANPYVYEVEREGMERADRVIAVSEKVKRGLIENYGIDARKIDVVYNAKVEVAEVADEDFEVKKRDKVVLYAGRVTVQKGPDYFVEAAAKVLKHYPDVKFVMAGAGDLLNQLVRRVAELGISDRFVFHGFYSREEGARLFRMADVFVMPSVSEPFGIVPLEAMLSETPSIISKQSGCSEVLSNALKVDFWDVDMIADAIVALLRHESLSGLMKREGKSEVEKMTWEKPAKRCVDLYEKVLVGGIR